nr:reverse transcriptase domain, reverse transcriptase zinc-binding domain protein [Tanacetum cinerariifolium]
SLALKVRKCIHGGMWSWPNDWLVKYRILKSISVPVLNDDKPNVLECRNSDGLLGLGSSLDSIVSILMPIAKRKSFKSCIGKLTIAAAAYFVWQEHNIRLFKNSRRSVQEVVDCIMSSVRLKLLFCRFKKSKDAVMFSHLWELPLSMLK